MKHSITAYEVRLPDDWTISPAPSRREWMSQTPKQSANRCLPLTIANQAGWVVNCPVSFKATWSGSDAIDAVTFEFSEKPERYSRQIASIFGLGIVSFSLPWLFRTSPGVGLIVRGPTNWFKPECLPLDGYVESDWAPYTFTMNWRIMKRKTGIYFQKGDPICMLQPYPLDMLEETEARVAPIESDPELQREFEAWTAHRKAQSRAVSEGEEPKFRLDYLRGVKPEGERIPTHRTQLKLDGFSRRKPGS